MKGAGEERERDRGEREGEHKAPFWKTLAVI